MIQVDHSILQASNNCTLLKDRVLWFDGDSSYPSSSAHLAILNTDVPIFVDKITKDIERYNSIVEPKKQIKVKTQCSELKVEWTIPEEYKTLNLRDYIVDKLDKELDTRNWTDSEIKERVIRVVKEIKLYEKYDLVHVLRVLIYIINTLNHNSVVWGVGRGSSVSSYVLYLIGVHDVDSVKYDLDIKDFLH